MVKSSSFDDLQDNLEAHRYDLVVKEWLKLVTHILFPNDDHVNAIMCCLDEFEHQYKCLTLEPSSMKVK